MLLTPTTPARMVPRPISQMKVLMPAEQPLEPLEHLVRAPHVHRLLVLGGEPVPPGQQRPHPLDHVLDRRRPGLIDGEDHPVQLLAPPPQQLHGPQGQVHGLLLRLFQVLEEHARHREGEAPDLDVLADGIGVLAEQGVPHLGAQDGHLAPLVVVGPADEAPEHDLALLDDVVVGQAALDHEAARLLAPAEHRRTDVGAGAGQFHRARCVPPAGDRRCKAAPACPPGCPGGAWTCGRGTRTRCCWRCVRTPPWPRSTAPARPPAAAPA